jgi:hypothetical protein
MPDTLKDRYPDTIKKLIKFYEDLTKERTATERQRQHIEEEFCIFNNFTNMTS